MDSDGNEVQSQEAHTVSCSIGGLWDVSTERSCGGSWVNSVMDSDKTAHACTVCVCIGVDSGVPVQKLMRYRAKSSLACSRAKFPTRVHLDLEASGMFRPRDLAVARG